MQKKVVRAITFSDRDARSTPLFHQLQLLKLNDIHTLSLLCFVYECRHHTPIEFFKNYFIPLFLVHDHRTRETAKVTFFISSINTTQYGKRTATYTGAILWNNLDTNIKEVLHFTLLRIITCFNTSIFEKAHNGFAFSVLLVWAYPFTLFIHKSFLCVVQIVDITFFHRKVELIQYPVAKGVHKKV